MENIKKFTRIEELTQKIEISDTLQARMSECSIVTFADLMNTNKREFMRHRGVGTKTLKEFVTLKDLLSKAWERCLNEEKMGLIDWEKRTWEAAVAMMSQLRTPITYTGSATKPELAELII